MILLDQKSSENSARLVFTNGFSRRQPSRHLDAFLELFLLLQKQQALQSSSRMNIEG
jgi:hypothetical protein